jgi:hypothetical protein
MASEMVMPVMERFVPYIYLATWKRFGPKLKREIKLQENALLP